MKSFPFLRQLYEMDCGPTCLQMVAQFYGKRFSLNTLKQRAGNSRSGVSVSGLAEAAESIGFKTLAARLPFDKLRDVAPLPCVAYWRERHYVVVYDITKHDVLVADPAHGLIKYPHAEFVLGWSQEQPTGTVLFLEPTPGFHRQDDKDVNQYSSWHYLFTYLVPYRRYLFQLLMGMIVASLLTLVLPFLTQALVDKGINTHNYGFVNIVLIAQLVLVLGRTSVEFIRGWLLLHISSRLSISILSDFLIKLMKLPISFFDTKRTGDLLQRIGDHQRIELFLSSQSLNLIFSLFNLIIFGLVLISYNFIIFSVFITGSFVYLLWVFVLLKRRRDLDFRMFDQLSASQSNIIQIITGIAEIKQLNSERIKRWEWEHLQAKHFRIRLRNLSLSQIERAGTVLLTEGTNILVTYLTARAVMQGQITLGTMLSIQYIIGQLNVPIQSFVSFAHSFQDAQISLERLREIHQQSDEEPDPGTKITYLPTNRPLGLQQVSFAYPGSAVQVLKRISLTIPPGKTTAIVGSSGSGKTTLVKLLLKVYTPTQGDIRLGDTNLANISVRSWREQCAVVMQDGFIFNDTIARNIAVADDEIDWQQLDHACQTANILSYIENLPQGYQTRIGAEGQGLSQGQRQRILIARAVYRNPSLVFLDEATNALDANNERTILGNLEHFLKGKTVVVVAHRLSTVVNADQIVVLDKGEIVETGTHAELTALNGAYYQLIRNQLELGTA